jgi:glucokinase
MSGDCGGTNTRLVLFRVPAGATAVVGENVPGEMVFSKKYQNSSHTSFEAVCKLFLQEAGGAVPATCCLACAGGIKNNSVSFTNVAKGWTINGDSLGKALGIPKVKLINDFEAQGYGLLTLQPSEKILLNKGVPVPGSPIACIGAGTGLGECFLTSDDSGKYTCWPSEGGHAEFSPRDEVTTDLLEYLKRKFGTPSTQAFGSRPKRVSVERVISGNGLANIFDFLRNHWAFEQFVKKDIEADFLGGKTAPAAVVAIGAAKGDYVCKKAVEVFSECYGSEAGVAALKWLPYGGLYISGGIAAKNPSWVQCDTFLDAYKDKGRLSPLVEQVPLYLVMTEDTGERGALFVAVQLLM